MAGMGDVSEMASAHKDKHPTPVESSSSDDEFNISDVDESLDEQEKKKQRREKIKKKIKEKAEREAQKLFKKKIRERDALDGQHSVSYRYETSSSNKSFDPSSLNFSSVPMGKVPKFNGIDYARWSDDMKVYLHGLHPSLWTIVNIGVDKSGTPSREQEYDIFRNSQAVTVLRSALSSYEYNKIRGINSAKELWDTLQMAHEGSDEVKEGKVDLLQGELEAFIMKKDELCKRCMID